MQTLFVCGEQNGNRKSHSVTFRFSNVTSQMSFWKYHLSTSSVGGPYSDLYILFAPFSGF